MKVKIRINGSGVREAGRSNGVYRDLERRADRAIELMRAIYSPHAKSGDYGRAFKKVRTRVRGKAAVEIVNTDRKAMWLERGTPPHVIEPKNKKALHWEGAAHPVGRVHHPGTPALHIMRRGLKAAGR